MSKKFNPLYARKKCPELETEGTWFDYCPTITEDGDEGFIRFKMRRPGGANVEYLAANEKASKPYRHLTNGVGGKKELPFEIQQKIVKNVFVNHLLVDWENVVDEDGGVMEFSSENALKLFDEETGVPDVYIELLQACQSEELFLASNKEDDSKN